MKFTITENADMEDQKFVPQISFNASEAVYIPFCFAGDVAKNFEDGGTPAIARLDK